MGTDSKDKKSNNMKIVILGVAVVVIGIAGFMLLSQGPSTPAAGGAKEFTIFLVESGPNRAWNPDTITVKVGDKVRLKVVNSDTENPAVPTYHRFVITEYNIDSGDISPGKEWVYEFTADKAGTFKYFDPRPDEQVGRENVRHSQEIGQLIVEP
jgi:plastocyanin